MPSLARRSGRYAPSPPPCAGPSAVAVVLRSDQRNPHALSPLAVRTSARRPVFAMTPTALSLGGKVARVHSRRSVRRHWQSSQSRLPTSDSPPTPAGGAVRLRQPMKPSLARPSRLSPSSRGRRHFGTFTAGTQAPAVRLAPALPRSGGTPSLPACAGPSALVLHRSRAK